MTMSKKAMTIWTFVVTSVAVFMVSLDNLVVTTALPVIKQDLGASLQGLEWTVNAYTLTFAVLLLTGAALGDRFGRKRMFAHRPGGVHARLGAGGAGADHRDAHRRARPAGRRRRDRDAADADDPLGRGAAAPAEALALGVWGGIAGLAVAIGPVVGGAVVEGLSWQWIFWLNVPIGVVLLPDRPLAPDRERRAPTARSTCPGSRWRAPACSASSGASSAATSTAGRASASPAPHRRRRRAGRGVRRLGAAHARARCCRCASSAGAPSRPRTSPRCS